MGGNRVDSKRASLNQKVSVFWKLLVLWVFENAQEVLFSLLNWMSEDDVYAFSQDEYDVAVNVAYKLKYDMSDASNEEERDN